MIVFIDTSALYALLNAQDPQHQTATAEWMALGERHDTLLTSNYVLVETIALIARRLGFQAVRDFQTEFAPVLQVSWVDEALQQRAIAALLTAGRRDLSLVDCTSFEVMRGSGIETAFAFDTHFAQQGFHCLP